MPENPCPSALSYKPTIPAFGYFSPKFTTIIGRWTSEEKEKATVSGISIGDFVRETVNSAQVLAGGLCPRPVIYIPVVVKLVFPLRGQNKVWLRIFYRVAPSRWLSRLNKW